MEQLNKIDKLAGVIDRFSVRQTKTGKEFASFTVVLTKEYKEEQYKTYISCSAFGKGFDAVKHAKDGDFITVTEGELSSWKQATKEHNDEYYQTGVKVWTATIMSQHSSDKDTDEISIDQVPF